MGFESRVAKRICTVTNKISEKTVIKLLKEETDINYRRWFVDWQGNIWAEGVGGHRNNAKVLSRHDPNAKNGIYDISCDSGITGTTKSYGGVVDMELIVRLHNEHLGVKS